MAIRTSTAAGPADFTVTSPSDGSSFSLASARGSWVALHFLLKTECPICGRHLREYAAKGPTVAGVRHVFLKPDSEEEIKRWSHSLESKVPIYRDPEARLAKEFKIPDGYSFHGETVHYPALVLLDGTGTEVYRFVGKDNSDRLPFAQFAQKVNELAAAPAVGEYNLPANRVALAGHDPVAYFKANSAVKGQPELASAYEGVIYHFSSAQHRAEFAAEPEKFVPTYGGWCATAMAKNKKVEIDPANFKITNGRLFLFYNGLFANARKDWNADETNLTAKADDYWSKLEGKHHKK